MLEIDAEPFWRLSSLLGQMFVRLETQSVDAGIIGGTLGELQREAEKLGLVLAVKQLDRMKEHFVGGTANTHSMSAMIKDLHVRVVDELDGRFFLALEPREVAFYRAPSPLFGQAVEAGFPTAMFEIEEAGKCRATGRYTACVFHLMRTMEVSIRSVARCLGIPDPLKPADRNWGNVLKIIKEELDRRWPTAASRQSGDGRTFEAIYASLDAMKNPWRNSTMHVEGKYTEEETRHIWSAVEGFMRALAFRCDEAGLPAAE